MRQDQARDPLGPIEYVVNVLSALLAAALLVLGFATAFGSGSMLGVGSRSVCAVTEPGTVPYVYDPEPGPTGVVGLSADSRSFPSELRLCIDDPDAGLRAVSSLTTAPTILLQIGFLVLMQLLVRRARTAGLFRVPVARQVRRVGWYLLIGSLVAAVVEALANAALVAQAVPESFGLNSVLAGVDVSLATLIAAVAALTVARVMRLGVIMREDLDATI